LEASKGKLGRSAYNTQVAVDAEAQIIVAHDVTQSGSDCPQRLPLIDVVEADLARRAEQMPADAGYSSQENLARLEGRNIDADVATGRARDVVAGTAKDKSVPTSEKVGPLTRLEAMGADITAVGHTGPL
jgi:hypothetical protein